MEFFKFYWSSTGRKLILIGLIIQLIGLPLSFLIDRIFFLICNLGLFFFFIGLGVYCNEYREKYNRERLKTFLAVQQIPEDFFERTKLTREEFLEGSPDKLADKIFNDLPPEK